MGLISDIALALGQALDRRFLSVLLRGLLLTIALLAGVTWLVVWLVTLLPDSLGTWPWIGELTIPEIGVQGLAIAAMLLLSIVLMFPVAAVFVGFFLEEVAEAVERRHYPQLPPARGPGFVAGLVQALKFGAVVVGANLLALILYLVSGPLAPFVFYAVNGYLLGREYFTVVAERRLPPGEAAALRRRHGGQVLAGGVAMAVPLSIPILNLVVPVLGVAAATHQFHRLRGNPRTGARTLGPAATR